MLFVAVSFLNVEQQVGSRSSHRGSYNRPGRLHPSWTDNKTLEFMYRSPLEVPRVAEYCNSPTKVNVGDEGQFKSQEFCWWKRVKHG